MDFIDKYLNQQNTLEMFRQDNGDDPRRELLQDVERGYLRFTKPSLLAIFSEIAIKALTISDAELQGE